MGKRLSDFVAIDVRGVPTLDFKKLAELSDRKFIRWYNSEMKEYIRNHGGNPTCSECNNEIARPEELVRYFGTNLHGSCFAPLYQLERNSVALTSNIAAYFDRILQARNAPTRI